MRGPQFSFTHRKTFQTLPLEKPAGMIIYPREITTWASAHNVFRVLTSLGGETGWLYANILWRLRGYFDETIGGPGIRRGRRYSNELRVGDFLDFWRVEALIPNRLLRLRAEMKVPGKAWLEFEIIPKAESGIRILQTAYFEPAGLPGLLYWYTLYPIHVAIFQGMITATAKKAESLAHSSIQIHS
jgi:Protein of unknown function (DUF2867)